MKKENNGTDHTFDINNEIKAQHRKVRNMPFKARCAYFWDYYKFHTIAIVFAAFLAVLFIHDVVTSKDFSFYAVILNAPRLESDLMETEFISYAGLDNEHYECLVDSSTQRSYEMQSEYDMAGQQKLMGLSQTKDLDIITAESHIFYDLAASGMMADLRDIFTEEELAEYEDNIYYIDSALIERMDALEESGAITAETENTLTITTEDILAESELHRNPQSMEKPVPVGIYIGESPFVKETGLYINCAPVFGFCVNTQRAETSKMYLKFIWDASIPFETMKTY